MMVLDNADCSLASHPMAAPLARRQSTLRVRTIWWKKQPDHENESAILMHLRSIGAKVRVGWDYNNFPETTLLRVTWPRSKQ